MASKPSLRRERLIICIITDLVVDVDDVVKKLGKDMMHIAGQGENGNSIACHGIETNSVSRRELIDKHSLTGAWEGHVDDNIVYLCTN